MMSRAELEELAGVRKREQSIQKQIMKMLEAFGVEAVKVQNTTPGGRYTVGKRGTPDIIGCLPGGRFLAIEVKKPGGVASAEQLERIEKLVTMGACAFATDSVDYALEIVQQEVRR